MIHSLYGIYDQKARCLVNTFMSLNDVTAERSFKAILVTPENSVFTDNPSDFNLIKIIDIDDQKLPKGSHEVVFGSQYSSDLLHSERIKNAERRAEIETAYRNKKLKHVQEILNDDHRMSTDPKEVTI